MEGGGEGSEKEYTDLHTPAANFSPCPCLNVPACRQLGGDGPGMRV